MWTEGSFAWGRRDPRRSFTFVVAGRGIFQLGCLPDCRRMSVLGNRQQPDAQTVLGGPVCCDHKCFPTSFRQFICQRREAVETPRTHRNPCALCRRQPGSRLPQPAACASDDNDLPEGVIAHGNSNHHHTSLEYLLRDCNGIYGVRPSCVKGELSNYLDHFFLGYAVLARQLKVCS